MRVGIYTRVSTDGQEKRGTVASQLEVLRKSAAEHGYSVVEEYVTTDEGYSGTRLDRPGLDRVRDGAETGAFEGLLVLCPDRLARHYAYQVLILEEFERLGVRVIFLEQPPTDDPNNKLLVQIQGIIAEYERAKIGERYRRGKLFRARQGEVIFWKVPYGYRRVPRTGEQPARVEVFEPEAGVVRQIFRWCADDRLSVRQITRRLTAQGYRTTTGNSYWATSTVSRLLRNEAYLGTIYYNRRENRPAPGRHVPGRKRQVTICKDRPRDQWIALTIPPIVDADVFARAQEAKTHNRDFSPRRLKGERFLLRRLVRCGACDAATSCHRMRGRNGTVHHYYYCQRHDSVKTGGRQHRCQQRNIRADALDDFVWKELQRLLSDPQQLRTAYSALSESPMKTDIDVLAQQLNLVRRRTLEARKEEERLLDAYQAGVIDLPQLQRREALVREKVERLTREAAELEQQQDGALRDTELLASFEAFCGQVRRSLTHPTFEEKQRLLQGVVDRVMVRDHQVEIHLKLPFRRPDPSQPDGDHVSTHFHLRSHDVIGMGVLTVVHRQHYERGCAPEPLSVGLSGLGPISYETDSMRTAKSTSIPANPPSGRPTRW